RLRLPGRGRRRDVQRSRPAGSRDPGGERDCDGVVDGPAVRGVRLGTTRPTAAVAQLRQGRAPSPVVRPAADGNAGRRRTMGDRLPAGFSADPADARTDELRSCGSRWSAGLRRRRGSARLRLARQPDGRLRRRPRTVADGRPPPHSRRLMSGAAPRGARAIAPRPQLLTYPDSLGGDLPALRRLLDESLDGAFHGVHILPPFPSSGDRGFAPVTYREVDPRFGSWDDIAAIAARHDVLLDVMINHLSRRSPEFRDFERRGRSSPSADLFITLDKVWPGGVPSTGDVARIFLRKPVAPFSTVTIESTGARETVWTSFGTSEWSEQIDLDVRSAATRRLIRGWLEFLAARGVAIVRLDAVGYVIKEPGTSCFM